MTGFFPHYENFTDFTPVVPKLYWDVYSQEQRIKALCMEYVKLVAFTDAMVDTVNDQYAIIEDMQARLPELINDEVRAELEAMIETGELNQIVAEAVEAWADARTAQVDQNTADIAALDERMDNLTTEVEETLEEFSEEIDQTLTEFTEEFEGRLEVVEGEIDEKENIIPISNPKLTDKNNSDIYLDPRYNFGGFANIVHATPEGELKTAVLPGARAAGVMGGHYDGAAALAMAGTWLRGCESALAYGTTNTGDVYQGTYDEPTLIDPSQYMDEGRMHIDCETFAYMVANGITYGNSTYNGVANVAIHPFLNPTDESVKPYWRMTTSYEYDEDSVGHGKLKSDAMARYLYDRGELVLLDPNDSSYTTQFAIGDIIYFGDIEAHPERWMGITHAGVFGGGIGTGAETQCYIESANTNYFPDGIGCRPIGGPYGINFANGKPVAKFSPTYTYGYRSVPNSRASGRFTSYIKNYWNQNLYDNPIEWDCAGKGDSGTSYPAYNSMVGARVVTIVPNGLSLRNVEIKATNKWRSNYSMTETIPYLRGVYTFMLPYGWDIKISLAEDAGSGANTANVCTQICTTDAQIYVPPRDLP